MRKYELTYLISDKVQESDLNKVTGKVSGYITELGGKPEKEEIWGRRKLAYPIKKQEFATYITLYFNLPGEKIKEFERDLRLTDGVLRQLLFVKDYGSEEITLTPEEIADTETVTEVIGGEKSFEAVEGETEESKDLMAVRDKDEEELEEQKEEEAVSSQRIAEEESDADKELPTADSKQQAKIDLEKSEEISSDEKEEASKPEKAEEENEEQSADSSQQIAEEESDADKELPTADSKQQAKKEEPKSKAKKAKKEEKSEDDEAERLSKLNEELDDILSDEL